MIALTYPWIIVLLLIASTIFVIKKHYWIAGILMIIAIFLNWSVQCFAIPDIGSLGSNNGNTLRVLAWNIDGSEYDSLKVTETARIINKHNPDVIFLSEDFDKTGKHLDSLLQNNYPYSSGRIYTGHIFYSKHRLDSVRVVKIKNYNSPFRIHTTITIFDKEIDIYGCHLASNNYTSSHASFHPDEVKDFQDAKRYLKNINKASLERKIEANAILEDTKQNRPTIIMGDFNDVCGSPTLYLFESAGFKDAWWEMGWGYGATIHYPLPYRIDHIMYNKHLTLKNIRKIDAKGLSDHDALFAEFNI